jgi:hypothetical protein
MTNPPPDQNQQTRLNVDDESSDSPYPPPSLSHTCADDILKKLSRRKLLWHSAIAAAGAVLLPSFITGCHKDDKDLIPAPGPNLGGELVDLKKAAQNLDTLRTCIIEVYDLARGYDNNVFTMLQSTSDGWANFIINTFIDMALALCSATAIATATPEAMPAIALFAAVLKDWGFGKDTPGNLKDVYTEFEQGRLDMESAIENALSHLEDPNYPANNYANLQAAWKDPIVFNGKTYTIGDLASKTFTKGDEYNKLHDAMLRELRKQIWNLLIMKCCTLQHDYLLGGTVLVSDIKEFYGCLSLTDYVRKHIYPAHKGVYVRAFATTDEYGGRPAFMLSVYTLGINNTPFSDQVSSVLFMDDTPGHNINDSALFPRSYVFQQFHMKKPDFGFSHELGSDEYTDFAASDDFTFTGGQYWYLCPELCIPVLPVCGALPTCPCKE